MSLTYRSCKSLIEKGNYGTKEEMQEKLDVFYLGNRISKEEYEELTALLASK